jgi:hypothetical protein
MAATEMKKCTVNSDTEMRSAPLMTAKNMSCVEEACLGTVNLSDAGAGAL